MVLVEFRIPLPCSVDEFQVAQLYMTVKASMESTGGGEGVEWIKVRLVFFQWRDGEGEVGILPGFTPTSPALPDESRYDGGLAQNEAYDNVGACAGWGGGGTRC